MQFRVAMLRPARLRPAAWPRVALAAALLLMLAWPLFDSDVFRLRILTVSWLLGALTVGVTVSLGYVGLFNMSQGSFYAIGAYTAGILIMQFSWPLELAMLVAVVTTALVGIILGVTALRVRGDYWALVSLAFTLMVVKVLENWRSVTRGQDGYPVKLLSFLGIPLDNPSTLYWAAAAVMLVCLLSARLLTRSFLGRAMLATRHDEIAAAMMGIPTGKIKLMALGFSAAIGGLAGACLTAVTGFLNPGDFDFVRSFNITLFAIVGGITSLIGGIVAAAILTLVTEHYRSLTEVRLLILGAAVVIVIFLRAGVFDRFLPWKWIKQADGAGDESEVAVPTGSRDLRSQHADV